MLVHQNLRAAGFIFLITAILCLKINGVAQTAGVYSGQNGSKDFALSSAVIQEGEFIPVKYSCSGLDISPELKWKNAPPGVKSFALIFDDPDAPGGTWVHWVIYNIPAKVRRLPEDLQSRLPQDSLFEDIVQGINSWKKKGYGGPCPPRGETHRYYFKLYALDKNITRGGLTSEMLVKEMKGHILAEARLMGRFSRE